MDLSRIVAPSFNSCRFTRPSAVARLFVVCIGSLCLACAPLVAQASDTRVPQEFSWFESSKDIVEHFSHPYKECVKGPSNFTLRLGRLAFNSPRLLGGQAARIQLSCASCHPSGRANQRFFVEQISSAPGTADVTHSFLSSAGGDGKFNPNIIPDLARLSDAKHKDRQADGFALFMHRLIEVEFDGREPPQAVFNALLTYLQSTDQAYCNNSDSQSGLDQRVSLLQESLALTKDMIIMQTSHEDLRFVISSTRAQLETLFEVYGLLPNEKLDQTLIKLSRDLNQISEKQNTKSRANQFTNVSKQVPTLLDLLHTHEATSAFNQSALTNYLDNNGAGDK